MLEQLDLEGRTKLEATNERMVLNAVNYFSKRIAKVQFLSIEPLLSWDTSKFVYPFSDSISKKDIDWVIIGQQTPVSKKTSPKVEWIKEIVSAADQAGIPVFLKDNLNPLFSANDCENYKLYRDTFFRFKDFLKDGSTSWHLRQEFPKVEVKA